MYQLIMIIHVLAAISLIMLVLVQQGKGATTGAAFGSGASQTVFGSRGSGSFLVKVTIAFVAVFFSTSIALNYLASRMQKQQVATVFPIPMPTNKVTAPAPVSPSSIPTTSKTAEPVAKTEKVTKQKTTN